MTYRTHTCGELTTANTSEEVMLCGWINSKRDHGNLLFIDLRDRSGITQCVLSSDSPFFKTASDARIESVVKIEGTVVGRTESSVNPSLMTGEIEVALEKFEVESAASILPFPIAGDENISEEVRLKYRYLDLRRNRLQRNMKLRSDVIQTIRTEMIGLGFSEVQTPILTASSPEGARDFLVPSRRFPGHFYALPQAPQQFKQLLMVAGFEKYFQIAPSFRDEDARADRSPGEFYQFDMEMSFCSQEDVFEVVEQVMRRTFTEHSTTKILPSGKFPHITYEESMDRYCTDKPDLRNPLIIRDVSSIFENSDFKIFSDIVKRGGQVKAIRAPGASQKSRKFFDSLNKWARNENMGGLGYIIKNDDGTFKGPISKNITNEQTIEVMESCSVEAGDAVFFIAGRDNDLYTAASRARVKICNELGLLEEGVYRFCWVVDFPMFEKDKDTGKIDFSHNPFSMPQGGMNALETSDPLTIKAYQYDIVCNGYELSSGAIRNHKPEIMYKAFEIAGYDASVVDEKFSGMINAFKFGAPPHGGCAPGIDRIIMLLADEETIREVIPFPLNQQAKDLMMNAPSRVSTDQLRELHLSVKEEKKLLENQSKS